MRPDGHPHVTPLYAAWVEGAIYFCAGERKAKNLAQNGHCVFTTGCNVVEGLDVIVEGKAIQQHDLIDEYWLWLQPAIVGKGNDLFDGLQAVKPLKLVEATPYPLGTVFLRYARG